MPGHIVNLYVKVNGKNAFPTRNYGLLNDLPKIRRGFGSMVTACIVLGLFIFSPFRYAVLRPILPQSSKQKATPTTSRVLSGIAATRYNGIPEPPFPKEPKPVFKTNGQIRTHDRFSISCDSLIH
jgi:hypothetical protein